MRNRLISVWERTQSSYWFIPAIMAVLAIILSIIAIKFDQWIAVNASDTSFLNYVDSPEGARAVLSTIASSMITIAGVVFSLMMVVLSLTSQQYGSFVLGNFMRDHTNQFILGVFTATFIYCLLILRTVHGVGDSIFVPHISILIGMGLALASIAVLIYFIHHVAYSIQSSTIIENLGHAMLSGIDGIFSKDSGDIRHHWDDIEATSQIPLEFETSAQPILSASHGYLQVMDESSLLQLAQSHNLLMRLQFQPGDFVSKGDALALIWPPLASKDDLPDITKTMNDAFILGAKRTSTQDIEMLFNGLNQVAIRALSPGINDPFTAMMCIDRLGEGLVKLAHQRVSSPYCFDEAGSLRVIVSTITFSDILSASFTHIYHYGKSDVKVVIHLLKTLQHIGEQIDDKSVRTELYQYAVMIRQYTEPVTEIEEQQIEHYYSDTVKALS